MKKINLVILAFVMVIIIHSTEIGYVKKTNGELFIKAFSDSMKIDEGYIINSKDTLATQRNSFTTICFADKSLDVMMKPESEIICTGNYIDKKIEKNIVLLKGSIFIELYDGNLNIKNEKNLVYLNKGSFIINTDNDFFQVLCIEGDCELHNAEGYISLSRGETGEALLENPPYKLFTDNISEWYKKAYCKKQTIIIEFTNSEGNIRLLEIEVE